MKDVEFLKQHNVDVDKSLELFGDMETYNDTIKEFQEGMRYIFKKGGFFR